MNDEKLAFFIGLLGSLHCIGMCGPLAFTVPVGQKGWVHLVWNKLIYQLGRIISYCLLGALVGLLGKQIWQAGLQQGISIFTGGLVVLAAASRIFKLGFPKNPNVFLKPFTRLFDYAFRHKANHLFIGMINGLLPCGFVYLALAGALNTDQVASGVAYMFYFGLGTVPLMLGASIAAGFSQQLVRTKLNTLMPYAMLLIGLWFILRGLELNIPYLSPQKPLNQTTECR